MHKIEQARLKPGASLAAAPESHAEAASTTVIRGRALIFWDRKSATPKKLDAIDTDQITPAADCVSESLDTLDERWKAGAFRYLMPDFRARVHSGQNFIIAGDRFAIGSSREMSPAGLKGVAEEAGREMVIICGHNMGDPSLIVTKDQVNGWMAAAGFKPVQEFDGLNEGKWFVVYGRQ